MIVGILGGKGMLGCDLKKTAEEVGMRVAAFDLPDFDMTLSKDLRHAVEFSDIIVNCAAYTNVDKAESEPALCRRINTEMPGELGVLASKHNKYVIHISTDFVFGDLIDRPLTEEDETHPLSVYGQSKLDGEKLLQASGCAGAIIRVEWTYGACGANFISKFTRIAYGREHVKVVTDQSGAPTSTAEVARAIICFIKKQPNGIYHFAADGYATRYEVAEFISRKIHPGIKLVKCVSADFPSAAYRPHNSKFDCSKIDKLLSFKRSPWKVRLGEFLEENFTVEPKLK